MSYSRINTFEWCQLKYYYSYIIKAPQVYGHPATLGNIIHKALEVTLEDGQPINKVELLQNYKAAIPEYDPDGEVPPEMIKNGEDMLIEFVNSNPGPVSVYEKEMPFSFILGRARLNGFIDYIDVDDKNKRVIIRDYKSGRRQVAKKDVPTNLQLGIYSLFAKHLFPDYNIYSELYYLATDSKRGHNFSDEDLATVEVSLRKKVNEVLDTENFRPTPNEYNCKWCSYAQDGTCPTGEKRLWKFAQKGK